MKKHYNVVIYQMDEKGRPERFGDRMLNMMAAFGLYKILDRWPIENEDGKTSGYIYTITGAKFIVDYLARITGKQKGEGESVIVRVDKETGQIADIQSLN